MGLICLKNKIKIFKRSKNYLQFIVSNLVSKKKLKYQVIKLISFHDLKFPLRSSASP